MPEGTRPSFDGAEFGAAHGGAQHAAQRQDVRVRGDAHARAVQGSLRAARHDPHDARCVARHGRRGVSQDAQVNGAGQCRWNSEVSGLICRLLRPASCCCASMRLCRWSRWRPRSSGPSYTGWDQKSRHRAGGHGDAPTKCGPTASCMEGYSLNMKHASSVIPSGRARRAAALHAAPGRVQAGTTRARTEVKKFVTGKGNSPKEVVMMHVLKRWGHTSMTNNTADASSAQPWG